MLLTLLKSRSQILQSETGSYFLDGKPVVVIAGELIFPEKGGFLIDWKGVGLQQSVQFSAESSSFQYFPTNISDIVSSNLATEAGQFTLDELNIVPSLGLSLYPEITAFDLAPNDVNIGRIVPLNPERGEYLIDGHPIDIGMSAGLYVERWFHNIDWGTIRIDYSVGAGNKKSSLYGIRNAIVEFIVPTSQVIVDPKTGNVKTGTTTLSYDLYLRKAIRDGRTNYPGVDRLEASYDGYSVYPSMLDSRIKSGTKGRLKFGKSDEYRDCVVRDARYQYSSLGTIGGALSSALGDSVLIDSNWQN